MSLDLIWLLLGLSGQAIFSARFLLQWLVSEKEKKSVVPVAFWYLSLFGGVILFSYAVHKRDLVFMLGQGSGLFVYLRNLHLIKRTERNNMLVKGEGV